jgi:hypothetical protein
MPAAFVDPGRVLLGVGPRWRLVSWPEGRELAAGEGVVAPGPGAGGRLAHVGPGARHVHVEGRVPVAAPPGPVHALGWDGQEALLAVSGGSSVAGPYDPGPTLLPVPATGCTAQAFGSFPQEGMRLWRLPLQGGPPECLLAVDGISRLERPVGLGPQGVAVGWYRYPVYGRSACQRLLRLPREGGGPVDRFPDLPGSTCGLAVAPDSRRWAFLHSELPYRLDMA